MLNPFENAQNQLLRATKVQSFPEEFLHTLALPEREVKTSIPVRMDDGTMKFFEGYRVQYSSSRGPYKGGIRFHHDTDINEVRALAFWMALKTAVAGIPMGGGKGGVTVDPKILSKAELERLSRGWVRSMYLVLGPNVDVPAPDVNTTPEIMSWMVDEYEKITGDKTKATFTGKPLTDGGSEGRTLATSLGGFFVFESIKEHLNLPRAATMAIQGMGNVGGNAAHIFKKDGHVIVAMSDSKGGIYSKEGLDPEKVESWKKENGSLLNYPNVEHITNEALLELDIDVLIPAALENQIKAENAGNIKAKVVLELANGPTTPEADDILFEKGVVVIPDILANAGGVIVSTFEWEQNLKGEHWTEAEVNKKLEAILKEEAKKIFNKSKDTQTDLRRAAFIIALERIYEEENKRNQS